MKWLRARLDPESVTGRPASVAVLDEVYLWALDSSLLVMHPFSSNPALDEEWVRCELAIDENSTDDDRDPRDPLTKAEAIRRMNARTKETKQLWYQLMARLTRDAPEELWMEADRRVATLALHRDDIAEARAYELFVILVDYLHWLAHPDDVLELVDGQTLRLFEAIPRQFRAGRARTGRPGIKGLSDPVDEETLRRRYLRLADCPRGCRSFTFGIYRHCTACGTPVRAGVWTEQDPGTPPPLLARGSTAS
jgi:hypothetical protein